MACSRSDFVTVLVLASFDPSRARVTAPASVMGCEVLFIDAAILEGGLELMSKFADQPLSLTDCVSFEVMSRLRLTAAFAFDDDFRNCGFVMVP